MDLTHTFTVPTTVEETWGHFQDIAALAECFPGASLTKADGDSFEGTCKVKLGPIALVYAGSGTFKERDHDAHRYVVEAKGRDKRGNGTAGALVTLSMTDSGGGTVVEVITDLAITGKPAQFGRGVMQDVSDKLLGQFVACLEERLAGGSPEAEVAPAGAADQDAGPASEPTGATAAAAPAGDSDAGPASAPAGTAGVSSPAASTAGEDDDTLDLGSAVLPILLKTYGKKLVGALVGLLVVAWVLRRLRR